MAARSEQILISIRTIGAAKARRDIDSVARATERLNKNITDSGAAYELNTEAMKNNYDQHQKQAGILRGETKISREYARAQSSRTKSTQREVKVAGDSTKAMIERLKQQNRINKMIKEGQKNAKILIDLGKKESEVAKKVGYDLKGTWKIRQGLNNYQAKVAREETRRHNQAMRQLAQANAALVKQERMMNSFERRRRVARAKAAGSWFTLGQAVVPNVTGQSLRVLAIIQGALALIPLLGTALNAVAAGGLAALNGLAPLVGILGAIPPAIAALGAAGVVFMMAFGGNMAKALAGDAKAMALLGPEAQALASAVASIRPMWQSVQNNVRENLFAGMGDELRRISERYLPMMNDHLSQTARNINKAGRNLTGWLQSDEGMTTNRRVGETNAYVVGRGAESSQLMLQTLLMVTAAAGPMIREMSDDVLSLITRLNNWVAGNGASISNFFSNAYDQFKGVLGVLGDYGAGVFNIIKASDPLTKYIGDNIARAGEEFRSWTETHGPDITLYFEKMKAPLGALVGLAGDVAKGIFQISQNPQFIEVVNSLSDKLVPAFVKLFENVNVTMINGAIDLLSKAIDLYTMLPSWLTTGLALGILVAPIISYFFGIGRAIAFLVTNMRNLKALGVAGTLAGVAGGGGLLGGGAMGAAGLAAGATLIPDGKGGFIVAGAPGGDKAGRGAAARRASGTTRGTSSGTAKRAMGRGATARRGLAVAGGGVAGSAISTGALIGLYALIAGASSTTNNAVPTTTSNNALNTFNKTGDTRTLAELWGIDASTSRDYKKGWNPMEELFSQSIGKHWYSGIKNNVESVWTSVFGGTTDKQKTIDNLGKVDQYLTTIPVDQAAKNFGALYDQAKLAGVPMEEFIDYFPTYKAQIESTIDPMELAGMSAEQLAARMKGAATNMGRVGISTPNLAPSLTDSGARITGTDQFGRPTGGGLTRFAGGMVNAGQTALVGELGPELAITRSGVMGLVGVGGMQQFSPGSSTAIVPSSATFDPSGGNYGNTPGWARDMLQEAPTALRRTPASSSGGNTTVEYKADIRIEGNATASDAMAIRSEVYRAFKQLEQERKERR